MSKMRRALETDIEQTKRAEVEKSESGCSREPFLLPVVHRPSRTDNSPLKRTSFLAAARKVAKASHALQTTKKQVDSLSSEIRALQAQIIAEKVGRCEVEKAAMKRNEQVRIYRDELAAAVRALRRAKEETKRLEEERRKGARLYEETKER
jgi:chromosome segregation ATPase